MCNNKTIKMFNESVRFLWRQGIMYDDVISGIAPYNLKDGQASFS